VRRAGFPKSNRSIGRQHDTARAVGVDRLLREARVVGERVGVRIGSSQEKFAKPKSK
jgi:hypothetical protein